MSTSICPSCGASVADDERLRKVQRADGDRPARGGGQGEDHAAGREGDGDQ